MDSDGYSSDGNKDGEVKTPAQATSSFLLHSPPGEFDEIVKAVKGVVGDDQLVDEQVTKVLPKYTKKQFTPVRLDGAEHAVILCEFNDLGDSRFFDPRTKKSFRYDYMTETATDLADWTPDPAAEPWRFALEREWTAYCTEHYHEGTGSVFSSSKNNTVTLNACLEGHQFEPKKYWNGRWRSRWSISFSLPKNDSDSTNAELAGIIRLHVHYYEDGNVQLISSRHCEQKLIITKPDQLADDIVESVRKLESEYQRAISENYQTMSDTTFKALRRPLPVYKSKIEWNKLMGYKIASELKQQ